MGLRNRCSLALFSVALLLAPAQLRAKPADQPKQEKPPEQHGVRL